MVRETVGSIMRALWRASCVGLPTGAPIQRYGMYQKLKLQFQEQNLGNRVLSISHSNPLCHLLGAENDDITEANYPEHAINQLRFEAELFSAVVSDQVFEHIECTPTEAVEEVHRVLRPGGLAIHTTCFMTPYHGPSDFSDLANGDFWRFTPSGLSRLHKDYSEVIAADGWGNVFMPLITGLGLGHIPVPDVSWHPLNKLARANRASYPYAVWVIARK